MSTEEVKSVIKTDCKTLNSINDSVLKDAFNISDDEELQNIKVFEEGIVVELNIDLNNY